MIGRGNKGRRHFTRKPGKVVIAGEPRTVRGAERRLAMVEHRLSEVIPFDEWVRHRNPTEVQVNLYRRVVAGLETERDRLIALRDRLAAKARA